MKPLKYRKDIQVFRGIAVIAVLFFHARERLFPQGFLGVDVFFVISGFVIAPLLLRVFTDRDEGQNLLRNLGGFYRRRFFRLAPALGVTLGFSAVALFFLGNYADITRFAKQGLATILLLGNWGASAFNGDYFSPNPNPLIHTWSLSTEEQIYLLLPIVIITLLRNRARVERNIYRLYVLVFLFSFTLYLGAFGVGLIQFAFYSPFTRMWEFCLGGLAFFLTEIWAASRWRAPWFLHISLALCIFAILFAPFSVDPRIGSFLACFTAFSIIIFRSLSHISNVFTTAFAWIGDRSYSIYVVHMPIVYLFLYSRAIPYGALSRFRTILAVLLSIGLGALCFAKVEQKYRIRPERSVVISKRSVLAKFVALPLSLFLVILVSTATISGLDGIPRPAKVPGWEWNRKCVYFGTAPTVYPPCVYRVENAKGSVLLMGDSHAATDSAGIVEAANNLKLNVFISTQAGCPFFFLSKAEKAKLKIDYSAWCLLHNSQMYRWIKQNRPLAVIYTIRSSSFMPPDLVMSRETYMKLLAENLRKLHAIAPSINHIGPNPEFVAAQTLIAHFLNPHLDVAPEPELDNQFWKNQSETTGVIYIDAIPIFCHGKQCINKIGSTWLYEDKDHLSSAGSRLLEPALLEALKKVTSKV